ncbi:MAG: toxin-activating lysine-acyltransferase [Alphaproteobacteria bacterium]
MNNLDPSQETPNQTRPENAVRELKAAYRSAAFGEIVSVLMRSPRHKRLPLEALRVFVIPAIATHQYMIAKLKPQANEQAEAISAGLAIWASVSDVVDQRLRSKTGKEIRLAPDEWKSGDKLWLVDLVAPSKLMPTMLRDLEQKVVSDKEMYVQTRSAEGAGQITTLRALLDNLQQ